MVYLFIFYRARGYPNGEILVDGSTYTTSDFFSKTKGSFLASSKVIPKVIPKVILKEMTYPYYLYTTYIVDYSYTIVIL